MSKPIDAIAKYHMLEQGDAVVVGVSGGADSVALLHVLVNSPLALRITAVHVNHNLRGQDALKDEEYVQELCRRWNVPLKTVSVNAAEYAQEHGYTVEEAGRLLRRSAFEDTAKALGGAKIATAHQRDDLCETVLHNILRGCGITGLRGILPVNGNYIHPLIDTPRCEIENYLQEHKIAWRQDASNKDSTYTRNRIRNQLLPYLKKHFNPNVEEALLRLSSISREEDEWLQQIALSTLQSITLEKLEQSIILDKAQFCTFPKALQRRILRQALEQLQMPLKDVHMDQIDAAVSLAQNSQAGAWLLLSCGCVQIVQSGIYIGKKQSGGEILPVEFAPGASAILSDGRVIRSEFVDSAEFANSSRAFVNADKISGTLLVRSRKNGDRFHPYGMEHDKKLKDYLIDHKIDVNLRNKIPLIVYNSNIVWVAGYTINDDYKITPDTKRILMLELYDPNH